MHWWVGRGGRPRRQGSPRGHSGVLLPLPGERHRYAPPRCPVVLPHNRKHVVLILESPRPLVRNAASHSQGGASTAPNLCHLTWQPTPHRPARPRNAGGNRGEGQEQRLSPLKASLGPLVISGLLGSGPGTGLQGPWGSPGRRRREPRSTEGPPARPLDGLSPAPTPS